MFGGMAKMLLAGENHKHFEFINHGISGIAQWMLFTALAARAVSDRFVLAEHFFHGASALIAG
jgi:hypothetical protein